MLSQALSIGHYPHETALTYQHEEFKIHDRLPLLTRRTLRTRIGGQCYQVFLLCLWIVEWRLLNKVERTGVSIRWTRVATEHRPILRRQRNMKPHQTLTSYPRLDTAINFPVGNPFQVLHPINP
jgi:hypothetical protein